MTLNEIRKAYKINELNVESAINETCNYLVTLDKSKMIDIADWIIIENKVDVDGLSYDDFFKVINDKMYIKIDTLESIISTLIKIDIQKTHKIIWSMIYKNKITVKHGKATFSECSPYGTRYYSGDHPYCIYK